MLTMIIGRRRQGKSTLAYALARERGGTVIVFDPNSQFNSLPAIPADVSAWLESGAAEGRYLPPPDTMAGWADLTAELDGGEWRWGEYTLIADEASMLMSAHYLDAQMERFIRTSPRDVGVVMTTHRASDLHPLARALASDWFIFQCHLARDLKALEDQFGPDVAGAVKTLPPYHVLHYWLDSGGVPRWEIWDNPREWFIEIGRIN